MNITSKVVAGVILCTGFVQVVTAFKVSIVKDDPSSIFEYVVDEGTKDSGIKPLKGRETKISFNDKSGIKVLRIIIPGQPDQTLNLLSAAEQKNNKHDLIRISPYGVPYYSTRNSYNTFKNSQPKSKL